MPHFVQRTLLAWAVLLCAGPGIVDARAVLVLDDPLQGSTSGTRAGGSFVTGGWQVTGKDDTIYWHVTTVTNGAAEFDVRGLNPNECRTGMEDKTELFHMYDYTFGNSDINYNGGYRDNPFKHFVRKTGCLDTVRVDSMEIVWLITPNYVEPDSAVLSWNPNTTYHFREEWGPDGAGNAVLKLYRDGVLLVTASVPGVYAPVGHSVRIAASPRRDAAAGAPLGAVFSNVKVWNLSNATPGPSTITQPANGETVTGPLVFIKWSGDSHARYQVRVNRGSDPDSAIVWDSGEVASSLDYAWTDPLVNHTNYSVFARLGSSTVWSPWSATGRVFRVDTSFVPSGANLVRVNGHSLATQNGPFLGLGASYFQALRRAKYDRTRLNNDLAFLASKRFNYVRVLSMVGWNEAWQGLEIAPVSFTNRVGTIVPAWPDYWQQFRDMIDTIHSHGLRAQVTIFADAQLMPSKSARQAHMSTMLQNLAGREHKVVLLEVANEAWQNGFPGSQGVADLREFTQFLADRTSIPVTITSNDDTSDAGITALYTGGAADIATVHFSRDIGTVEDGWLPVRDCYRAGQLPGVPPVSSNEPIGPGSSVSTENDPVKLVMAAAFAWGANLPMYVFHSSAGVFGQVTFQSAAGVGNYTNLANILPPDFSSWVRNDGKETSAPFTAFANGQTNRWWPEVASPTSGAVRNTGANKGTEFVTLPIGILSGGLTLEARRPMRFRVYHPLAGTAVQSRTMSTGEQFTLGQGPGAYIIKGIFLDAATPLVPRGAIWKYLDNGSNQGTAWRSTIFNDSAWTNGPAQLGFGDNDEATVINGGPSTNRYVTTYFRRAFPVADVSAYTNLLLRVLRDDAAVVYLNGLEVFRSNMPTETVTYTTFATNVVGGAEESTFFSTNLSPALLVNGTNLLAVEIHQANATSTDLGFDLELFGVANLPPVATIVSPANNATVATPASFTINALAYDADGGVSRVEFFVNSAKVGEDTSAPYSVAWTNVSPGDYALTAVATDGAGASNASAAIKVFVKDLLVPAGSIWKYLDTGTNLGTAWRAANFNDSTWSSGPAQLGYGDSDESTVVSYGPQATNKYVTTYFRRALEVADTSLFTNVIVRLLRDDGAIVYLNGVEVFRSNMPTGAVTYTTFATNVVAGAEETTFFVRSVNPSLLVTGTNVLAVEVHQANLTSTDVSFDLELVAESRAPPPPRLAVSLSPSNVVLTWPGWASGFRLEYAPSLNLPVIWTPISTSPGQTSFAASVSNGSGFYRLARD